MLQTARGGECYDANHDIQSIPIPLSQPCAGLSIDCAELSAETFEALRSAVTFVREQTEQQDQAPRAFARLEEGLKGVRALPLRLAGLRRSAGREQADPA